MKLQESESAELKAEYTSAVKKEVVAFANSKGGVVYIGVTDEGEVIGVEDTSFVLDQISSAIRDGIRPNVSMFTAVELLKIENKAIIKLTIHQGTKRPYSLSEKGLRPPGVYVRKGTASAPASEDAIRMMIKMTDGDSFEMNRSLDQDLTFHALTAELGKRELLFSDAQMKKLGIMTSDRIYTNLGLLVSDQCRHSIKLAVFQGSQKTIFKDRKELSGSLFTQLDAAYRLIDF